MKKKIRIAVALVVAASLLGWYGWQRVRGQAGNKGRIFVSGNIEATEVNVSFRLSGQIDTLPIEEGDRVEKGKVIATLDTDTLVAQRGGAKAEIARAEAVLSELEEGTRPEVVAAARAQLKAAESKLVLAKDEYDRHLGLFNQKAISTSTLDSRRTSFQVATEEFNNAAQRLLELEKGPRDQQILAARAALDQDRWLLKKLELDIRHSVLEAPVNGMVMVKANETGEVVLPGATVVTIAALDEVWLKGYVGEQDLGRVKLGQKAQITTDTYPNKVYEGRLTYLSPRAEFTPKNVQTREERVKQVYRAKITIKNPH